MKRLGAYAFPASLAGDTVKIFEIFEISGGGFWAPSDSFEQSPSQQAKRGAALPADAEYNPDDVRIWQAWILASEQAKNASFILAVEYAEALLSSDNPLSFNVYRPNDRPRTHFIYCHTDELNERIQLFKEHQPDAAYEEGKVDVL